jgi:hypothetical protein
MSSASLLKSGWILETPLENFRSGDRVEVSCRKCGRNVFDYANLIKHRKCVCEKLSEAREELERALKIAASRGGRLLAETYPGSKKKVYWECEKGHLFSAIWQSVVRGGTWCGFCSGRYAVTGTNDLATKFPITAAEFLEEKNLPLCKEELLPFSSKKVWWICPKGHEYDAKIYYRTKDGHGCPYCSNHRVFPGFNDLQTKEPRVADEWHPTKNGALTPTQVTRTANKTVYWLCTKGHETRSWISSRVYNGGLCSKCVGRTVEPGETDLGTLLPDVAREWHPTRNGGLSPSDVTVSSNKSVWWLCTRGHEWENSVNARKIGGCPFCANKLVRPGFNDFATVHPDLLEEWSFEKNKLDPTQIITGGNHRVFWKCLEGHEDYAVGTYSRAVAQQGCPSCSPPGFKPTLPAATYFFENTGLHARKIGITNIHKTEIRIRAFENAGWKLVQRWDHQAGYVARALEHNLLRSWIQGVLEMAPVLERQDLKLGGYSETFGLDGPSNAEIVAKGDLLFKRLSSAYEKDADLFALDN